jgi:hypothetical protein
MTHCATVARAQDLFKLNRLRPHDEAAQGFDAAYRAFGVDESMRGRLESALADLVPVKGLPVIEATSVASMAAGVLVGLLIADSALPTEELDLPVAPSTDRPCGRSPLAEYRERSGLGCGPGLPAG